MKLTRVLFGLLLSSIIVSQAQARSIYADQYTEINTKYLINQPSDCVSEYITLLSETDHLTKACHVSKPLLLLTKYQDYPSLTQSPRQVEYWEGSVEREVATVRSYRRELVDTCRGRIISSHVMSETDRATQSFDVENPNLSPAVHESFMLVPLADQYAKQELARQMHLCQTN